MKKLSYVIVFCFIMSLLVGCKKYDKNTTLTIEGEPLTIESMQKTVRNFDDYSNEINYRVKYKSQTFKGMSGIGEVNSNTLYRYKFDLDEIYKDDNMSFYAIIRYNLDAPSTKPNKGVIAYVVNNKLNGQSKVYEYPDLHIDIYRKTGISDENIIVLEKAREEYSEKNKQEREARTQTTSLLTMKELFMEQFEEALQ